MTGNQGDGPCVTRSGSIKEKNVQNLVANSNTGLLYWLSRLLNSASIQLCTKAFIISLLDLSSPFLLHRKTWLKSFVSPPCEHQDARDRVKAKHGVN